MSDKLLLGLVIVCFAISFIYILDLHSHLSLKQLLAGRPDPHQDTGAAAPELEHHQAIEQEDEDTGTWHQEIHLSSQQRSCDLTRKSEEE